MDVAEQRYIKYLAITDHVYNSNNRIDCKNEIVRMSYACKTINSKSTRIINGGEFNLKQHLSGIDRTKILNNVPWRLAGLHTWYLDPTITDIKDIPAYFEKSIQAEDGRIQPTAFAHIERELYKCKNANEKTMNDCLASIVNIAANNNIILEINESSIRSNEHDAISRMKFWIEYAKNKSCMFSLGSDAHYCNSVGDFTLTIDLLNSIGISQYSVLNTRASEDMLRELIGDTVSEENN